MDLQKGSGDDRKSYFLNLTLVALIGQVGCLTLFIVLAALFAGLWLDNQSQTRPFFTIILLLASIPISVVVMVYLARKAVAKLKVDPKLQAKKKEGDIGIDRDAT